MLRHITLPAEEMACLKATHYKLIGVLRTFTDKDGRCWPTLRQIAAAACETLGWVQRNLNEMQSLEYFARARGPRRADGSGGAYTYQLAKQFLVNAESRQQDSVQPRRSAASHPRNPQVYSQPESRQQDIKKEQDNCLISKRAGGVRRVAATAEARTPELRERIRARWHQKLSRWLMARSTRAEVSLFWRASLEDPAAFHRLAEAVNRRMRADKTAWEKDLMTMRAMAA